MKVIFLDHDGVMCLRAQYGSRFTKPNKFEFDEFDAECIQILNEILGIIPDIEIVVSSNWREYASLGIMREMYKEYGIIKQPISYTPKVSSRVVQPRNYGENRVIEIKHWLNQHNLVEPWVAIDDLDLGELGNGFLRTKEELGIKEEGFKEKIISLLSEN